MTDLVAEKRILVVEDEKPMRDGYAKRLAKNGFKVTKASGLAPARAAIRRTTFHIAWVDLSLRGEARDRDGYLLINDLIGLREKTKILVVTHWTRPEEVLRAVKKAGADDFLSKEFTTPDEWPRALDKLKTLLSECRVDVPGDLYDAKFNMIHIGIEHIATGSLLAGLQGKAPGRLDANILWNSLTAAYNKIKPVRRPKSNESPFVWDAQKNVFTAQYWSKGAGSAVELVLGIHSGRKANIVFERTKGVPITVRTARKSRDDFED